MMADVEVFMECVRANCPNVYDDRTDSYKRYCSGENACRLSFEEFKDAVLLYGCGVFKVVIE
jgi:hypothetical protein